MHSHVAAFIPLAPSSAFRGQAVRPHTNTRPNGVPTRGHVIEAVAAEPRPSAEKPKKLSKVEGLKTGSKQLRFPLNDEMQNDEIFITNDAVQIMKFHGSYQQVHREQKRADGQRDYQFMLRLKMPGGEFPASLYKVIDDIATTHGNNTLRATTRCAWQIHGIAKADLKPVFSAIMNGGGSCTGACGDLSRNVMCTPAPFTDGLYAHARWVSKMIGELFAPQSGAFSEIWLDGEKAATLEFWKNDLDMGKVNEIMRFNNGNGVVFEGGEEPIYGETYLPRKFKIGVTVPGDNSIDVYTQDIGVVCVPDATGAVVGYNIIVGGGLGRTHRKEETFARVGDHLGYVARDKLWEALKAIVATQRDHGNRSVRANARMKYLVDKLGIDDFRALVETYFGEHFEAFRELKAWKYEDWLGWHEQGDGNLFLGLFIENGRIKDEGAFRLRTALRKIVEAYDFDMVVTPNQNIILKNIAPNQRDGIEAVLKNHAVQLADEYNINRRLAMACPALPLCGLATTEAERVFPDLVDRLTALFVEADVKLPVTSRMTGCPNGCARPYMAEIGFVGNGPNTYQLWLGGCPNQTRLAWTYMDKMKVTKLEETLKPILQMYKQKAREGEAFGDFCDRMGKDEITRFVEQPAEVKAEPVEAKPAAALRVTSVRAPATVTVLSGSGSVESSQPINAPTDDPPAPPVAAPAQAAQPETSAAGNGAKAAGDAAAPAAPTASEKKPKIRPRLTVSDDIMDRLKNIAALRDMTASNVADEIITTYLSSVSDEDMADGI